MKHFDFKNILPKLLMRTFIPFKDASTNQKTGSKDMGQRSGESPSALISHRGICVRNDCPYFKQSKFFSMRTQKSNWDVAEIQVSYQPLTGTPVIVKSSKQAHKVFLRKWDMDLMHIQEQFYVLFLNNAHHVIGIRRLALGNGNSLKIDMGLFLSLCCKTLSKNIIIAHNHPSGSLSISAADMHFTTVVEESLKLFEIRLLDHLILAGKKYVSFADRGIISKEEI